MIEKTNMVRKCNQCGDMTQYRVKLTGIFVCNDDRCLKPELPANSFIHREFNPRKQQGLSGQTYNNF